MRPNGRRRTAATTAAAAVALALAGCGDPGAAAGSDRSVEVLASFYPLQYLAEQVGGEHVDVASLTPPGAEPHDLELSPRQVRRLGEADVVVVLTGFQPAVDDAVAARSPEHLVDAAETPAVAAHLGGADGEHGEDHAEEGDQDDEAEHGSEAGHAEEHGSDGASPDGHDHAGGDPHFWLDPTLMAAVAVDLAAALAAADPAHADDYRASAERVAADLTELDSELATGLADCERRVIVTAHDAFGFLAERYGLQQVGISGLDPEAEPSPARLREIRDVVTEHGVTTLFTEALVDPRVTQTLADDLGITTAVLDPLESQADGAADYRDAMLDNLAALRTALGCS